MNAIELSRGRGGSRGNGGRMSACEKCWSDAYVLAMKRGGHQADHYAALLIERRDNPCTPRQQAGEWWDPQTKRDMRELGHESSALKPLRED